MFSYLANTNNDSLMVRNNKNNRNNDLLMVRIRLLNGNSVDPMPRVNAATTQMLLRHARAPLYVAYE